MSWFSLDALQDLTSKVQEAIPKLDKSMMEKLTLTTPELKAERQRIDEEERRKERVRNMLAGMLPWETHDPDRDILVEECKEAILKLSDIKDTFFGPYPMPKAVQLESKKPAGENEDDEKDGPEKVKDSSKNAPPSKESLQKLEKLHPLPPLLEEFDLDSHVGLIQRLLVEDPKLAKTQSSLSGGGAREKVFWHNYFFHCAFTRYEAGLSIDEIWSEEGPARAAAAAAAKAEAASVGGGAAASAANEEQTITFNIPEVAGAVTEKAFPSDPITDPDAPFAKSETSSPASGTSGTGNGASITSQDYEMVSPVVASGIDNILPDLGDDDNLDYELDELEAEIAKELND